MVLITGETGVGKSRLVQEFVASLGEHGPLVVRGTAPPIVGSEIPFAPIAGAIRDLTQRIPDGRMSEVIPQGSELARLLHAHSADDHTGADPLAQVRLFEQWLSVLVRLSSESEHGLVLVLEDLHWIDASSRDLLAYLITNLSIGRVLVLLTVRSDGMAGNTPLRRLLLEATRQPWVRSIDVEPLSSDETRALLATLGSDDVSSEALLRIAEASGGNPLFAEQLIQTGGSHAMPRTLLELVRERLDRLSSTAKRVAELASTAVSGLPVALLEEAAAGLQLTPAPALDELRDAGILTVRSEPPHAFLFRHPFVQEVVYAELMPAERQVLHRAFGDAMGRAGGDWALDPAWVLELARQLWLAGDRTRALPVLVSAADTAMDSFAFSEALVLYERAIEATGGQASPPQRTPIGFRPGLPSTPRDGAQISLVERAARAASLAGHPERALELLDREPVSRRTEPTFSMRRAEYLWQAGLRADSLDAYTAALDGPVGGAQRAALQGAAARAMLLAGRTGDARQLATDAVELARANGAESEQLHALYTLSAARARLGDPKAALETLEQARELDLRRQRRTRIQPRPSRIVDLLSGYWSEAAVLGSAGRTEEAAAAAMEGARAAAKLGIRGGWGGMVGVAAAEELIALGRWQEAQSLLEEWLAANAPPSDSASSHAVLALLLALRGHVGEAGQHLLASQEAVRPPIDTSLHAAQLRAEAEIGYATGQASEGARSIELAIPDLHDRLQPAELVELVAMSLRAAADRADNARARRASAELAVVQSDAIVLHGRAIALVGGTRSSGTSRLDALMAWVQAEYERVIGNHDPARWHTAGDLWAALREPYRVAYMQFRAAAGHMGRPEASPDARSMLTAAHATCLELGAEPLRREIEALARRARLDLQPSGASPAEATAGPVASVSGPPFGLSRREVEVLELIADGRTNRQIGEALLITKKTAGHHVSSILGKLGVTSRVEAASMAARAGIGNPAAPMVSVGADNAATVERDRAATTDATLMFTDIVSSTALLEAIGDAAWLELIAWHDELIRALIRAYSGREVDHAGDGFFVVFPDVIAALDCSVAIQRALAEHRRKQGFAPRLRVAIHRARVLSQGQALRGKGVHEAARIAEAARGDEILVSSDSLESVRQRYVRGELRTVAGAGLSETISTVLIEWRPSQPAAKPA